MDSTASFSAFDIVALASSLGGLEALTEVLSVLPDDFPAPVVLCQHLGRRGFSELPRLLSQRSRLKVAFAEDGEPLESGRVYVAPPDWHLLVGRDRRAVLSRAAKVKFCRPAGDPLLVSAAAAYGSRTLGVVLTGCNTDGSAGAQAIKWVGGMVLAQDRATSRAFGMPRAAIETGCVDHVLPLPTIASALIALVMVPGAAALLRVPLRAA